MEQSNARPVLNRGHTLPMFPSLGPDSYPIDSSWLPDPESTKRMLAKEVAGPESSPSSTINLSPPPPSPSPTSSRFAHLPPSSSSPPPSPNLPPCTNFYRSILPVQRSTTTRHGSTINPTLPTISTPSNTRAPVTAHAKMELETSSTQHILLAPLGSGFHPDCITIAARKGNVLVIVADRWELEKDCHYEWQVQFDRDADMSNIHASFDRGLLKITVQRIQSYVNQRPT